MTDETPKLNRRQQNKIRTRGKILDATRTLIAANGYEAATIRDISTLAGMSTGAFFASFDDKEAVYREIYGHSPITVEQGRALALLVAGFQDQARPDHPDTTEAEEMACSLIERKPADGPRA